MERNGNILFVVSRPCQDGCWEKRERDKNDKTNEYGDEEEEKMAIALCKLLTHHCRAERGPAEGGAAALRWSWGAEARPCLRLRDREKAKEERGQKGEARLSVKKEEKTKKSDSPNISKAIFAPPAAPGMGTGPRLPASACCFEKVEVDGCTTVVATGLLGIATGGGG